MKTLVIGYGNCSRTDDGVGWFVIEELQKLALPGVELLTSHQLTVDHAETVSQYDTVIFVDASTPESRQLVTRTEVQANLQVHAVAHYLTPADLLALSQALFGHAPHAILFSIRGDDFSFGTALSPATERAARGVVRQIVRLASSLQQHETGSKGNKAAYA
jgi:hydrogenase maturation protease